MKALNIKLIYIYSITDKNVSHIYKKSYWKKLIINENNKFFKG